MKSLRSPLVLLFFCILSVSAQLKFQLKKQNSSDIPTNLIDGLNKLNKNVNETGGRRDFDAVSSGPDPPDAPSKAMDLFNEKMIGLMETNLQEDLDVIAKYSNEETQILLCGNAKKSTFAELGRFVRLLHIYFKSFDKGDHQRMHAEPDESSMTFELKYTAISMENTEVPIEWHGAAVYDANLKYYVYTRLELKTDCTKIPDEIPEHPVQPKETYINRLESNLKNVIFTGKKQSQNTYDQFNKQFLLDRTKVKFCELNGKIKGRDDFRDYLFKRYADVDKFEDSKFKTEAFSDYQTDALFTITGTWKNGIILKDTYRFRVEEAKESGGDQGWVDWWSTWVIVECPVDLTPKTDPDVLKKKFINQVCGSIAPMVNNGPSVSSRSTFVSHFMKNDNQGFHAQICENQYKPIYDFSEFDKWLETWSGEYTEAKLSESKVESYENFAFICVVDVMKKNDKEWKKRDFRMKAYFETDTWLIKETKIGCDQL
uniref:DUF4440 domain-containing protein n=1 Tax=Caenorhabditis tropicalis TaxID=1561998 RepID=A0A1I7UGC7_9PELO